jgi:hypothetical protein
MVVTVWVVVVVVGHESQRTGHASLTKSAMRLHEKKTLWEKDQSPRSPPVRVSMLTTMATARHIRHVRVSMLTTMTTVRHIPNEELDCSEKKNGWGLHLLFTYHT